MRVAIPALALALSFSPLVAAKPPQCQDAASCNKQKARDLLNQGVQAYKVNDFDSAIEKFKAAADLDPDLNTARLYLAAAYANLYIPGYTDPANLEHANQAIATFKEVLARDPTNLSAIDGIGSLLFNMAAGPPPNIELMKESRSYHQQHIRIKPDDPDPYYWVGMIDWTFAFKANTQARMDFNKNQVGSGQISDGDPLPGPVRVQFAASYGQDVNEGIAALQKAIELRPDYEDAMAYLNLLDRQKADMVESPDERKQLQEDADALIEKVMEIKRRKASQPGGVMGGIVGGTGGPDARGRIRVATAMQEAKIINQVTPAYPALARQARIQGTVRLHAIISKEGEIEEIEAVSGPPILIQAAMDAVKQWRYKPTLLSDEPVEVETYIDVIFTLGPGPKSVP